MTVSASVIRRLNSELGDGVVSTKAADLEAYSVDWSWGAVAGRTNGRPLGHADAVVKAVSEEDVATTVRIACEEETPLVARGGGSGVMGACVPTQGGIVLDLSGLTKIVTVDEESLTVAVQAGHNGLELERTLNQRGLSFPHYPASSEWATVGGYVAARGSGVLSTRYGKIEDLVLSLRIVTPVDGVIDTVPVPRHAVGPELTQLFVGSEGTLGVITRATLRLIRLPAVRRFEAVSFPSVAAGVAAIREILQRGYRPAVVRMYDSVATRESLSSVVGAHLSGICTLLIFEGEPVMVTAEAEGALAVAQEHGAVLLDGKLAETWWERRYDFYRPPHYPTLPAIWGTIDAVATYDRILDVYAALRDAIERPYAHTGLRLRVHFSHWYEWGTMIYPRFVIPQGPLEPQASELYERIWKDGVDAILSAGGVINDHHGVGTKLAPFMRRQWGAAFETLLTVKRALDPLNVMNPGKLGFPPGPGWKDNNTGSRLQR